MYAEGRLDTGPGPAPVGSGVRLRRALPTVEPSGAQGGQQGKQHTEMSVPSWEDAAADASGAAAAITLRSLPAPEGQVLVWVVVASLGNVEFGSFLDPGS